MSTATDCNCLLLYVPLSLLATHCTANFDNSDSEDAGDDFVEIGARYVDTIDASLPYLFSDECPGDPGKTEPGICGCGRADTDSDGDGTADCNDDCPNDPHKTIPGKCGCDMAEGTCLKVVLLSDQDLQGGNDSRHYFFVMIPVEAQDILISLFGGTGDADLYVKHGADVSSSTYDCRPWILGEGLTETCTMTGPGLYSIMVRAHGTIDDWSLTASYK